MDLEEHSDKLRQNMAAFWTQLASGLTGKLLKSLKEAYRLAVKQTSETIAHAATEDSEVEEGVKKPPGEETRLRAAGESPGLPQAPEGATRRSELNNGKSAEPSHSHQDSIRCPECGSSRVWRDGVRRTRLKPVQRWLCRSCGFRFSESTLKPNIKPNVAGKPFKVLHSPMDLADQRISGSNLSLKEEADCLPFSSRENVTSHKSSKITTAEKGLYAFPLYNSDCRVSASESEAKNLAKVESRQEKPMREGTTPDKEVNEGLITQYMAYLEKEGYYEKSAYLKLMKRLARIGADLSDPENVKTVIAKQPWKNSVKMLAVYAYDLMVKQVLKVQWTMPKYIIEERLPFVPEEKELDQLISACRSRRMATFLQTLKETYADPGEVLKLEWKDISGNVITINSPVKGHSPRQLKVSSKLIAMLNALPKTSKRIFPSKYDDMLKGFLHVRKRAARNLQNPRLLEISFRTFRHWGGTMIAHYTHGNVLMVQKLLGHKRIQNTMKYIHMVAFKDDEFEVATATTVEEAKSLLAVGFDYVAEKDGIMLFRKPKRFNA